MAEALSQSQIDDLLNKMLAGNTPIEEVEKEDNKIKEYDFSSPKKFTKDQLKSLNNLYENYARILSSYFTSTLRTVCEVETLQIEEQRYYEFNNALPDNTLVGMISFRPENQDESTVMYQLPTAFGFLLIDRLMGGTGNLYAPDRPYTEVELSLLQLVLSNVTKYMKEAWTNLLGLETSLRSVETNGRMLQAYSPQDVVVIISMELKSDVYTGLMNVCMPAENLESVIKSFSVKFARSVKQQDPQKEKQKRDLVLSYLKRSDLSIEAELDCCQMSLADIAMLQKDDVIALNKKINSNILIRVEGNPWYTARLGEVGKNKAIKLVDSLVKGNEG